MNQLTAMHVFSEVAQRGSFSAAAAHLDMTRVMVTRHVNQLENWLGARLLQRSTRHLSLTDAGKNFLPQCQRMLDLSAEMQNRAAQQKQAPKGQLRITCTPSFGAAHLAAAIGDYLRKYPAVAVDMLMVDRTINLIEERVDIAIRVAGKLDPSLVARRIAPCRSVVCASPSYIQRHGLPLTPAELGDHNCITYSNFGRKEWHFTRDGQVISVPISGNLNADEVTFLNQATLSGIGIALQPTFLAGPQIRNGQLIQLLPDWQPPELNIWAVYLSRHHLPATLRTMLDFLVTRFGQKPDWELDSSAEVLIKNSAP